LHSVYKSWQDDDGGLMAAAVAYYAALSFFPLLLVLISGFGLIMQYTAWGQDAEQQVLEAIADYASPTTRDNVAAMLKQVQRKAALGGPLGIFGLIFTAVALFAHFESAFDRIWNVEDPDSRGILSALKNTLFVRLRAFLMLFGIALLTFAVFVAGMVIASLKASTESLVPYAEWVWWAVQIGVSVALNTCVFTLLYKLLPKVPVSWSQAFAGGFFAAALWEISRLILAAFILGEKYSAYGIVGSFIAVMLWIYCASSIVFLGAEYVQVICQGSKRKPVEVDHAKLAAPE
jgi:membrane protein